MNTHSLGRFICVIALDGVINIGVLMVTYPIWREFKYQRYPVNYWIHLYVWAGLLITIPVVAVGLVISWYGKARSMTHSVVAQIVATLVLLSSIAVFSDFSEPDPASQWPSLLQEIAGKFFAELQSVRFTLLSASCIAVVSGLLLFAAIGPQKKGTA